MDYYDSQRISGYFFREHAYEGKNWKKKKMKTFIYHLVIKKCSIDSGTASVVLAFSSSSGDNVFKRAVHAI